MAAPLPRPAGPEREARPLPTAAQAALLPAGRALPHAALPHAGRAPASISRPLRGGPRAERGGAAGGTAGLEAARGPASPFPPGPGGGAVRTGAAGAVLRAGWREGVAAVPRTRWLFNKPGAFTFGAASVYKNTENDRENILQARRQHRLTWGRAAAGERRGGLGAKASRAPAGHQEPSRRTGPRPGTGGPLPALPARMSPLAGPAAAESPRWAKAGRGLRGHLCLLPALPHRVLLGRGTLVQRLPVTKGRSNALLPASPYCHSRVLVMHGEPRRAPCGTAAWRPRGNRSSPGGRTALPGAGLAPSLPVPGAAARPRSPLCTARSGLSTGAAQRPPFAAAPRLCPPWRGVPRPPHRSQRPPVRARAWGPGAEQGLQPVARPAWPGGWPRSPPPVAVAAEQRRGREATGPRVPPLISATELEAAASFRAGSLQKAPAERQSGRDPGKGLSAPSACGSRLPWAPAQAPPAAGGERSPPAPGFAPGTPSPAERAARATRNERNTRIPAPARRTAGLAQAGVQGDPLRPGPAPGGGRPARPAAPSLPEPPGARAGAAARDRGQASKRGPGLGSAAAGATGPARKARSARGSPRRHRPGPRWGSGSAAARPGRAWGDAGLLRGRPAPPPQACGEETKAEPGSVAGTACSTVQRALPPGAPGGPDTRARCCRLPAPRSGAEAPPAPPAPLARGANETVPAPPRRPPRGHRAAGRLGPAGVPPATALNGADRPPEHSPRIARSGAGVRGSGQRCEPAAGTRGPERCPSPGAGRAARSGPGTRRPPASTLPLPDPEHGGAERNKTR
ncbi:basic proline-rich protein-like [Aquila chrysaetos chrysaetos]|uniref:basic proline-rich protein-like n=1 Tax=Aquila chrysaetos chrysaetos TaxID=223781 RepID=UPI0011770082|nr:basic proline-rich protein-like [Aquila chrysaetos chrysaetos]